MKFASGRSIDAEMKRFSKISKENPEKGRAMYEKGELLIALATKGEISKFRRSVEETTDPEDFLLYFVYKALRASLIAGHLMIASYIVDNGYPLNMDGVPNVCHECLKELDDYLCVAIVRLLTSKGLEVNRQSPGNWFTALHYSIERKLLNTVELLISLGADVNAVGENDVMPLNLALALSDSPERTKIIDLLQTKGAKETWRRSQQQTQSTYSESYGFGSVSSSHTNISVSNKNGSKSSFVSSNGSISGNSSISNNDSNAAAPKKFVKFTGGGGPVTYSTGSTSSAQGSAAGGRSVSSSGAGGGGGSAGGSIPSCEAQSKTPPDSVFNSVDQISGSAFHLSLDGGGESMPNSGVRYGMSSDGGMMFSTGN